MNAQVTATFGSLPNILLESNELAVRRHSVIFHQSVEDAYELKVAALEQLPGFKAKQYAILRGPDGEPQLVYLEKLHRPDQREKLLEAVLAGEDNEGGAASGPSDETQALLAKVRERFDRAGVPIADVLVRFRGLSVTGLKAVALPKRTFSPQRHVVGALQSVRYLVSGKPTNTMLKVPILDDVSSVLRPGRFTLLLGPPGAGKTTLMRALAGQIKGEKTLKVKAEEVTYNGLHLNQFVVERTAAYISQIDTHFGELTVRETLDFSAFCQTSRTRKPREMQLEEREKELGIEPDPAVAAYMMGLRRAGKQSLITDIAIKALGLEVCEHTLVGNAMIRGISGGQRKRVTTGEMLVGPAKVIFADEISTGLDSATTYDICLRLKAYCHTVHSTILVSLLQPTPETYGVFDDVMLLSAGKIIFHGPQEHVLPFFEGLNLLCPVEKGAADFLQEVSTPGDQQLYWAGEPTDYRFIPEEKFQAVYAATEYGQAIAKELAAPASEEEEGHEALAKRRYGQGIWTLFWANLRRQKMLFLRNDAFIFIRIAQCVIMGIAVGTLFLQQSKESLEDAQMFMSVSFFSIMTQLTVSFAAPGLLIERLPVYYKQRNAHFYPAWCFALPEIILQVPLIFAEAWIWTLMIYFMVGFHTSARLFIFWVLLLLDGIYGLALFFLVAVFAKTIAVAAALQNLLIMVFTISSGFVVTSRSIPDAWKAAYWANPVAYFLRALVYNEFSSPDWAFELAPGVTAGEFYMAERGYQAGAMWIWLAILAWGVGGTLLNTVLFCISSGYLNGPSGKVVINQEELQELSVRSGRSRQEVDPLQGGGGSSSPKGSAGTTASAKLDGPGSRSSSLRSSDIEEGGGGGGALIPAVGAGAVGAAEQGKVEAGASSSGRQGRAALPFRPVTMTFQDVKYSVPLPKDSGAGGSGDEGPHTGQLLLLKGISGSFRPGVLTALMGSSGAGKTTLMDCLALRKTGGKITGDVRVNGFPQKAATFMRIMGYCEQTDLHVAEATVHEALVFSARLRLPSSVPAAQAEDFVEEIMDLVELGGLRDAMVGLPGVSGLSVEQRKRLTIAVELVANPSIVFMDEPTSGLDARAAAIVMRSTRRITSTGRTVVCTIHQPSAEIFGAFDELLLLKRGGETIFNGPLSRLVPFFENFEGVPRRTPGTNPATWMLDATSATMEKELGLDFAAEYRNSQLCASNEEFIAAEAAPKAGDSDLRMEDLVSASAFVQTKELLRRNLRQYSRLLGYVGTRFFMTVVIGIFFGTIGKGQGDDTNTFNGVLNIVGIQYSSVMFMGMVNCMMVQSIISVRRTVYYREVASGTFTTLPFAAAEFLVEIPYLLGQAIVYSLLVYWLVGFVATPGKFFYFLAILFLSLTTWTFFGIQNVQITPSLQIANAFTSFCFGVWDLFCGFYKPYPIIPRGWRWLYWLDPVSYTLYGLVVSELGDVERLMRDPDPTQTVGQFVRSYFGYKSSFMGWIVLILAGFCLAFSTMSFTALRYIKWQNR